VHAFAEPLFAVAAGPVPLSLQRSDAAKWRQGAALLQGLGSPQASTTTRAEGK
jgi:hypothetical protein